METLRIMPKRNCQKIVKRNQIETLELKSTIINEKLTGEVQQQIWTSRRISLLEDWLIEMIQAEERKEKSMKSNEQGLRDLQDTIKYSNIYVRGSLEREKREKGAKGYLMK